MCFGVKILNFVYFGVKKSGISVFLVSAENGAGVNKMTNITYAYHPSNYGFFTLNLVSKFIFYKQKHA